MRVRSRATPPRFGSRWGRSALRALVEAEGRDERVAEEVSLGGEAGVWPVNRYSLEIGDVVILVEADSVSHGTRVARDHAAVLGPEQSLGAVLSELMCMRPRLESLDDVVRLCERPPLHHGITGLGVCVGDVDVDVRSDSLGWIAACLPDPQGAADGALDVDRPTRAAEVRVAFVDDVDEGVRGRGGGTGSRQ